MPVVDWRGLGKGLVRGAERVLPVNMGMFIGTMAGDRQPITEKQLQPNDVNALRSAAADALALHNAELASARSNYDYAGRPLESGQFRELRLGPDGKLHEVPAEVRQGEAFAKYMQTALRKPSIQYVNYPAKAVNRLNEEGFLEGIKQSFQDPAYRMATLVGRANLQVDPKGNVTVIDAHDWNHRAAIEQGFKEDPWGTLRDIIGGLAHPTTLGNMIGTILAPKEAKNPRQVRINLGLVKPQFTPYDGTPREFH